MDAATPPIYRRTHEVDDGTPVPVASSSPRGVRIPVATLAAFKPYALAAVCEVMNVQTATVQSDLQAAIDDASPGNPLKVTGTCVGNFSVRKDLKLLGPQRPQASRSDDSRHGSEA
jgi:hypothetical protein